MKCSGRTQNHGLKFSWGQKIYFFLLCFNLNDLLGHYKQRNELLRNYIYMSKWHVSPLHWFIWALLIYYIPYFSLRLGIFLYPKEDRSSLRPSLLPTLCLVSSGSHACLAGLIAFCELRVSRNMLSGCGSISLICVTLNYSLECSLISAMMLLLFFRLCS